jgi:allophanate hydrolase subunit 2
MPHQRHWLALATLVGQEVPADRIKNVDAGRVLAELFSHFSETRVTYQKVSHGIALTEWLAKNAPDDFKEIAALLSKVLSTGDPMSATPVIQAAAPAGTASPVSKVSIV